MRIAACAVGRSKATISRSRAGRLARARGSVRVPENSADGESDKDGRSGREKRGSVAAISTFSASGQETSSGIRRTGRADSVTKTRLGPPGWGPYAEVKRTSPACERRLSLFSVAISRYRLDPG